MVKKIKSIRSLENFPFDIFEALKRTLVHRGLITTRHETPAKNKGSRFPGGLAGARMKSHEILFRANTVFPFTLFPDTVTLDREKVTFAERFFFKVAKITSVPVRDLLSVEADIGPFFGSVHTASRYFVTNPKTVKFLWREDAIKLQRLLQGYIIVHEQDMECSHISTEKLRTMLLDLGKGATD